MADALDPTVPAGWHPDPWGSASQRWWDGAAWTENLYPQPEAQTAPEADYEPIAVRSTFEPVASYRTAAAPTAASPYPSRRALRESAAAAETEPPTEQPVEQYPEPAVATAESPPPFAQAPPSVAAEPVNSAVAQEDDDWAASLARWHDVETVAAPLDDTPIFGDAPPISYSQHSTQYQPRHGRTSAVWLIVFMPLLQAASVLGSTFLFPELFQLSGLVPDGDPLTVLLSLRDWLLFAALPLTLAFLVFTFVLGFQDRSRLRLLGHDQTASPWWIVLNPLVYLIVRSVRVRQNTGRRGSGPLTTYVCLYIAPAISVMVAQAVISALYGAIPA